MKEKHELEYISIMQFILNHEKVMEMEKYVQHGKTSTYNHCVNVSKHSYRICKKLHLDYKAAAVAGMLHDFFIYDWKEEQIKGRDHIFLHPKVAWINASQFFELNAKEEDIIIKHMFPLCKGVPKSLECLIVSMVDKYLAIAEFTGGAASRLKWKPGRKKEYIVQ